MKLVSFKLPEGLLDAVDELVRRNMYSNRSEVFRVAIRDLVRKELDKPALGISLRKEAL